MPSTYPSMDQYNASVQHPQTAFSDPILRAGKIQSNGLGLPVALGGGFALTYTVVCPGKKFAVRCFHKPTTDLQGRYTKISNSLRTLNSGRFVGFEYQPQGILVNGTRYPIVKMDWVEGETLGSYLETRYSDKAAIDRLRTDFVALERLLREKALAHGDLQNGNVIVNSGVKLIDYDGMFVPGMAAGQGTEIGHRHFQHPKRAAANFGATMDRFSFIVIDLSLRALLEEPGLFQKYSNGENILLTASDFSDPGSSAHFKELRSIQSLEQHVDNFRRICAAPADAVPSLEDFIAGRNIPAVSVTKWVDHAPKGVARPAAYIGAYDVLNATDFDGVLRNVGNRIELIGLITDVKLDKTRHGRPYVFLNFGNWKGRITKINIWSDGLAKLNERPASTWVGKWISVTGLVDPAYSNRRFGYTHLSITVTQGNQLRLIDSSEAARRLMTRGQFANGNATNQAILDNIRDDRSRAGVSASPSPKGRTAPAASASPRIPPGQQSNRNILDEINRVAGVSTAASGISRPTTSFTPSPAKGGGGVPIWVLFAVGIIVLILLSSLGRHH